MLENNNLEKSRFYCPDEFRLEFFNKFFTLSDIQQIVKFLEIHPDIKTLKISNCSIITNKENIQAFNLNNTGVRELILEDNNINDITATFLASNSSIVTLSLYYNKVTDVSTKIIANLKNLRALDLRQNKISDEGVKTLASMNKLEVLFLKSRFISDVSIKFLMQMNLAYLYLWSNSLTEEGIQLLSSVNLEYLCINGNIIYKNNRISDDFKFDDLTYHRYRMSKTFYSKITAVDEEFARMLDPDQKDRLFPAYMDALYNGRGVV